MWKPLYANKGTGELFVFHGKPINTSVQRMIYNDFDRTLIAEMENGEFVDLGVRIQCLIRPYVLEASEVQIVRTAPNGQGEMEAVDGFIVPLQFSQRPVEL